MQGVRFRAAWMNPTWNAAFVRLAEVTDGATFFNNKEFS